MLKKMYLLYFLLFLLLGSFFTTIFLIYFAPIDKQLGIVQKIFYFHMPSAVISMFLFFMSFIFSIIYLIKMTDFFDILSRIFVEIGVLLSSFVLISGMLWAKKSWGVYWVWDTRLTFTLIMWSIYISYLIIRNSDILNKEKVCSVISIFGFVDIPLVHFSVRKWGGIHPVLNKSLAKSMPKEMVNTLHVSFIFIMLLVLVLFVTRYFLISLEKEIKKLEYEVLYRKIK